MRATIVPVLTSCLMILAVGCSKFGGSDRPKTYPVSGTVTMTGKPVEGATVTFELSDASKSAVGVTDASGKYTLSTFASGDGALPGQYKVSVTKYDAPAAGGASTLPTLPPGQLMSGEINERTYAPPPTDGRVVAGGMAGGAADSGPKNLLPAKYSTPLSSGLIATVGETGENKFDFDLK